MEKKKSNCKTDTFQSTSRMVDWGIKKTTKQNKPKKNPKTKQTKIKPNPKTNSFV